MEPAQEGSVQELSVEDSSIFLTFVDNPDNPTEYPASLVCKCIVLKSIFDDSDDPAEAIPVNMEQEEFEKIMEFARHLQDEELPKIEKPLLTNDLSEVVPEWYANYVRDLNESIFSVILSANYLNFTELLAVT